MCCYFIKNGQGLARGFKNILVSVFFKLQVVTKCDHKSAMYRVICNFLNEIKYQIASHILKVSMVQCNLFQFIIQVKHSRHGESGG